MAEELILDVPGHQRHGGTNLYKIKSLSFIWLDNAMAKNPQWTVQLVGENGTILTYTETDPVRAESDIKALNTMDLSVKSLQRRLFEVLVNRGALPPGAITGVPD